MSRGARIALACGLVLVGVVQALAMGELTRRNVLIAAGTWSVLLVVIAALVLGQGWACRTLAALVLAACLFYVYGMLTGGPILSGERSEPSLLNACVALVVFGVPAGRYLIWGRLFPLGERDGPPDGAPNEAPGEADDPEGPGDEEA